MLKKILMSIVLIGFLLYITPASYASEAEVIMKMLMKKGIITQAEYNEVMSELGGTDHIEKRVESVEKKTRELEKNTAEHQDWATHVDKHITHAEGPAFVDGISIAAGVTMSAQGTSGNDENAAADDAFDGSISADLELSTKMGGNGEAFIALEAGSGTGLTDEFDLNGDGESDLYWGFNADVGPDSTVDMTEAWYEHTFADGMVILTVGKLDITNYFDGNEVANDETTQFLTDGFVNDPTIEFIGGPGVRLTVSPSDIIHISIGAQSDGWEDLDEKSFLIAEADFKPKIGELQGHYRFHVWTNRGDHTDAGDASKTGEHGVGFGISADQQVMDFLSLFARLGMRDDDLTEYEFDTAWSGGTAISGSLWNRSNDILGLAYGRAITANHRKDTLRASGKNPGDEGHFEAYYNLVLNDHVTISPDLQVVTNAQGDKDFKTVVIGGVRGQFTF
jgi:carbohydrate-selective porin OprB